MSIQLKQLIYNPLKKKRSLVNKMNEQEHLLSVNHLTTSFKINGEYYPAVDDVSFNINKNEVLALVGESGSGKRF